MSLLPVLGMLVEGRGLGDMQHPPPRVNLQWVALAWLPMELQLQRSQTWRQAAMDS